ncbi:YD repeat protein [Pseudomonas chlororaphis]|uniref:YD repeat protein n=1 Tax=Pseudomonas chlororaphis TaxID=587753 RepID=A0A3G7TS27_9PSED|nr:RHS repeat-associated core domain-containing protein [Pseudomonas chlororaphis]AZE49056.1 YD repeat protein [Pseudomonas chlororaphis]
MKKAKDHTMKEKKTPEASVNDGALLPWALSGGLPAASVIGFNGQLLNAVSGTYLLGNGYRAYSPAMRAFYSPDSLSPFGAGGVSRYQYCNLNPVNYTDPSGHSVVGGALALIGALSVVTGGVATGLEVGRRVHEYSDPEYSSYLRELSIGFGVASAVLGTVAIAGGVGRSIYKAFRSYKVLHNRSASDFVSGARVGDMQITSGGIGSEILTHGRPFLTQTSSPVSGRRLAEQLADNLPSGPLKMTSCYAGFGGRFASQAQVVANSLDRTVLATTWKTNGLGTNAVWAAYRAQSPMRAAITQTLNTGLSRVSTAVLRSERLIRTLPVFSL